MPIAHPDADGLFPDLLARDTAPVVPDANWIRSDLLYAVRNGRRTAFITAANVGVIRLYCASHVVSEVHEHLEDWCSGKTDPDAVRERWESEYLPLLRVVDPPSGLLSNIEQGRVDALALRDPDDVPSATLAIALRATYLSRDNAAREAVYGRGHDLHDDQALLDWLFKSSDAAELAHTVEAIGTVVGAAGYGIFQLLRYVWKRSPERFLLLLVAGALGASFIPRDRLQSLGRTAADGVAHVGRMQVLAVQWRQTLSKQVPAPTAWCDIAIDCDHDHALSRAIAQEMARRSQSHVSAVDMAQLLPQLPVAQGEKRVRATLRESPLFVQVYSGRWQLGSPWPRASHVVDID